MTITDQFATNLTAYLTNAVTLASTVDNSISREMVEHFDNRVVVVATSASLRHPHVQGIYDLNGEVIVQQSIDSENSDSLFRALTEQVRAALEDKYDMPNIITSYGGALRVHSWNLKDQEATPSQRGFQAVFTWDAFAELPHS